MNIDYIIFRNIIGVFHLKYFRCIALRRIPMPSGIMVFNVTQRNGCIIQCNECPIDANMPHRPIIRAISYNRMSLWHYGRFQEWNSLHWIPCFKNCLKYITFNICSMFVNAPQLDVNNNTLMHWSKAQLFTFYLRRTVKVMFSSLLVCLFVCMLATNIMDKRGMDFHEIFRTGLVWNTEHSGTFWARLI